MDSVSNFLDKITNTLQNFGDSVTSSLSGSVDQPTRISLRKDEAGFESLGVVNESHVEQAIQTNQLNNY